MTKQIEAFEAWWADTGEQSLFALNTTTDDDIKILASIAWEAAIREALAEPVKQEPVAWINEDELPEHYPYEEMFNASTIIDGVRMFPNVKMSDRSMFYGLTKDHTWLSVTESQFNKLKPEKRMKCYLTPVDAKAIRAEALEQAAKVCEQGTGDAVQTDVLKALWKERERIAEVIRGLK